MCLDKYDNEQTKKKINRLICKRIQINMSGGKNADSKT